MSNLAKALVGGLVAVNLALVGLLFFRDRSVAPARAESGPAAAAAPGAGPITTSVAGQAEPVRVLDADPIAEPATAVEPAAPAAATVEAAPPRTAPRSQAPAARRRSEPAPRKPATTRPTAEDREAARVASRGDNQTRLPSDTWPSQDEPVSVSSGAGSEGSRADAGEAAPATWPAEPARPRTRSAASPQVLSVPAGSALAVRLEVGLNSREVRVGDRFEASLLTPLSAAGKTVAPAGSPVTGRVEEVIKAGKVKGREQMKIALDSITIENRAHAIESSALAFEAEGDGNRDVATVGGAAAAGAVLGAILGGGDGAAKGAAVGAAAGTGVIMSTRGRAIELASGTRLDFMLEAPLRIESPAAAPDGDEAPRNPPDVAPGTDQGNVARRY